MTYRVPLLFPVYAVIHRLDIAGTRAVDPPGDEPDGYNDRLGVPIPYESGGVLTDTRTELASIRVPCQVEEMTTEELAMEAAGDSSISRFRFVFHRRDLNSLGLLDANRHVILKKNDRISEVQNKAGSTTHPLPSDLYIFELKPRSWGMGADGYDLIVAVCSTRPSKALG